MGYFSIPLAKMVGPQGKVICVDVQQQMLDGLRRRAAQAGVLSQVTLHRCEPARLGLAEPADFVLAFWMLHEVPDQTAFLAEIAAHLKPNGRLLIVEPRGHVSGAAFHKSVEIACERRVRTHGGACRGYEPRRPARVFREDAGGNMNDTDRATPNYERQVTLKFRLPTDIAA